LSGSLTENLAIWANRATHTYSANEVEAQTTIDQCEAFLGHFAGDRHLVDDQGADASG